MHATAKITKRIRDIARDAYKDGHLRAEYSSKESAHGAFRSVLVEGGIAIKLAWFTDYAEHNQKEWLAWHRLPPSVQAITAKPFCISACGRVMAVELVPNTLWKLHGPDPIAEWRNEATKRCREFNNKLRNLLDACGKFDEEEIEELMSDNHENNIGVRESGELCWIDYAGCW